MARIVWFIEAQDFAGRYGCAPHPASLLSATLSHRRGCYDEETIVAKIFLFREMIRQVSPLLRERVAEGSEAG